jgi:hypothetical protein
VTDRGSRIGDADGLGLKGTMVTLDERVRAPIALGRKSAAYVRRNYRRLVEDPSFFWMKTVARFEVAREWAAGPTKELARPARPSADVRAKDDFDAVLSTLRRDGYYVGLSLSPATLSELRAHMHENDCYGDRNRRLPLRVENRARVEEAIGHPLKVASHMNQQEDWPVFQRIKRDPWILAIARAYLGREPVYQRSEIAWSFPHASTREEKRAAAQVLHCDINDFRTIKIFFYLTDVEATNGPHAYVKKHPRRRTLKHQILGQRCASLPEGEILDTYGAAQLVTICGPAGLGFAGDPYYFHRGSTPVDGARALMQLEYGCRRYNTWYFDV